MPFFRFIRRYCTLSGRCSRTEFWLFQLFYISFLLAAGAADTHLGYQFLAGPVSLVVSLALFVPSFSAWIRRLHDIDRTGWWILICAVPFGVLILIVFALFPSTPGENRFGPEEDLDLFFGDERLS